MATTTTTFAQHNMGEAELTKLEQFVEAKFCWDSLDEAQREKCIAYEEGPRLQFKTMMGMKYGWDVAGAVRLFWNDVLCPRLQHHYRDNRAYILKDSFWDGNTKCLMIGTSTKRSRPAVLIMSEDKGVAKRFARIIKRDDRFQASCFDLLASNSSLEFRAGNEGSFFGTQITTDGPFRDRKYATLGGFILVGGKPFGLTVAHMFFKLPEKNDSGTIEVENRSQSDDGFEVYDPLEDLLDEEDELDQPSNKSELTERDRIIFLNNKTKGRTNVYKDSPLPLNSDRKYVGYTLLNRERKYIGYNDLDWALINIEGRVKNYTNEFFPADRGYDLSVEKVTTDLPTSGVLVCSANRAKETRLSRTKTLVSLPLSSAGLETAYAINGICDYGECGSWVIDSKTGDAFGVLVAVSVVEDLSYVVPLCNILERIRIAWGTSVELLTESKFDEIQHSHLRERGYQTLKSQLSEPSLRQTGSEFDTQAPPANARLELDTMEYPPQLPLGWIAQWDSKAQKFYYVQISTGISTWDVPKEATDAPKTATPLDPALEPRIASFPMPRTPHQTTYDTSTRDVPQKSAPGVSSGGAYGREPVPYYVSGGMNMLRYDVDHVMERIYHSGPPDTTSYDNLASGVADSPCKPAPPSPIHDKGKNEPSQP